MNNSHGFDVNSRSSVGLPTQLPKIFFFQQCESDLNIPTEKCVCVCAWVCECMCVFVLWFSPDKSRPILCENRLKVFFFTPHLSSIWFYSEYEGWLTLADLSLASAWITAYWCTCGAGASLVFANKHFCFLL